MTGRGLTYERMGDRARARADFQQALASRLKDRTALAKSALATAQARLAALDSGALQPENPGGAFEGGFGDLDPDACGRRPGCRARQRTSKAAASRS